MEMRHHKQLSFFFSIGGQIVVLPRKANLFTQMWLQHHCVLQLRSHGIESSWVFFCILFLVFVFTAFTVI